MEVSPLAERNFSGIPNVAKNLAREMLRDPLIEPRFFYNRSPVPVAVVRDIVEAGEGGDILRWVVGRHAALLDYPIDGAQLFGLYTAIKWHRRLFPREIMIVHDLTTIVTPQYHIRETLDMWQRRLPLDMGTSDLLVAVSESTLRDVRTYYPQLAAVPAIVAPLASDAADPAAKGRKPPSAPLFADDKPYVVVLGTLEPRKNVSAILDFLSDRTEILQALRFVFVGRLGWGDAPEAALAALGLQQAHDDGDIVLTGFVADDRRDQLVEQSTCVLYPSAYEGFGLPVLEALNFGVPVVIGRNSSLPEVGGDRATYCDWNSHAEIELALKACLAERAADRKEARESRRAWARTFTWRNTYETIRDAALRLSAAERKLAAE
jgi:glycosyltransferase involved in cell wall biosynthesis